MTDPNKGTVTSVTDPNKEQTPCGFVPRKHTRLQMAGAYPALRGGVCDESGGEVLQFNDSCITYDEFCNPTSDGEWLYAWEKGRQLKAMSKASETVVFEYNASGLRVKKIATSTGTTHYTLHGKQITHLTNGTNTLHFFYDAAGKPAMVEWNNGIATAKYAYIHNLQGDIIALIDNTGAKVVSYTYDAWGKPLSTTGPLANTLGKLNPFRYRGYVFDEETGLYYLRSRYYCPHQARFINADTIIAANVFSYCNNNGIYSVDADGKYAIQPPEDLSSDYSLEFVKAGFEVYSDPALECIAYVNQLFTLGDPVYVLNSSTGYVGRKKVKAYIAPNDGEEKWIVGWIDSSKSDPLLVNVLFNKGHVNKGDEISTWNLQLALNQLVNYQKDNSRFKTDYTFQYINVDGGYGPETENAVTVFQKYVNDTLNIPIAVDGLAGSVTCRHLAFVLIQNDPRYIYTATYYFLDPRNDPLR